MSNAFEKIIFWALISLLIASALAHGAVESWAMAILEMSLLGLLLSWGGHCAVLGRLKLLVPAIAAPLTLLFLLALAYCVTWQGKDGVLQSLSSDFEASRMATLTLLCLIIAFLLFANYLVTPRRIALTIQVLTVFGVLLSIFGLIQRFTWNGKFFWVREPLVTPTSPFGSFVNHNHFAGYVEMLLPLPLAMVWMKSVRNEQRILFTFAVLIMGVAVFVSLSRGGMISVIFSVLFVTLLGSWAQHRRTEDESQPLVGAKGLLVRVVATASLLVLLAAGSLWVASDQLFERIERTQLVGDAEVERETLYRSRGFIWNGTLRMIAAHPVLGVGFGAFATAYPQYGEHDSVRFQVAQAHNDYLQILADCGAVGGLLALWFMALLFRSLWHGIQHQDARLAAWCLGAGGGIFALMVHSIFDFNLQLPSNAMLFLFLSALVSVLGVSPSARPESLSSTGRLATL